MVQQKFTQKIHIKNSLNLVYAFKQILILVFAFTWMSSTVTQKQNTKTSEFLYDNRTKNGPTFMRRRRHSTPPPVRTSAASPPTGPETNGATEMLGTFAIK